MPSLRTVYRILQRSARSPESAARGVAIGFFVGFLPSIGVQVLIALGLASVLNANRLIAALGTLVSNPITNIPIAMASIAFGHVLLPGSAEAFEPASLASWEGIKSLGQDSLAAYLLGCFAFSTFFGVLGYWATRVYLQKARPACGVKK